MLSTLKSPQLWLAIGLVAFAVASRTVLHIAPNFEWITAITLLSAVRLKGPYSLATPAIAVILSDTIIGNTNIFLFTWSGFAASFALGYLTRDHLLQRGLVQKYLGFTGLAITSVLVFYFWTNLGVIFVSSLYPVSLSGYVQSLIMALPFLKMQLISAAITAPIVLGTYELVISTRLVEDDRMVLVKQT